MRHKNALSFYLIVIFLLLVFPSRLLALAPEKLTFEVTWSGLGVGEVSVELSGDGPNMKILGEGRSAAWVSIFYKISDTLATHLEREEFESALAGHPYSFNYRKMLHEDKLRLHEEITMSKKTAEARYLDHLKKHESRKTREGTAYDPLTLFYYIRRLPLSVGNTSRFQLLDRDGLYEVEVQVIRKEKIKTALGAFDAILLKPVVKDIPGDRGLMYIKGDLYIWLTDDEKRLPVLVQKTADVPLPRVIPKSLREGMKKAKMTLKKIE